MHRMAAMSQISWLRWVSRSSPHSEPKTVRDCSIYLQAKKALNGRERKQDSLVSIWAKHDKLRSHFHVFWKLTKISHLILRQKPPDLVLQAWQQQKKRLRRSSRWKSLLLNLHSSESSFGLESIFSGSWHGSSLIPQLAWREKTRFSDGLAGNPIGWHQLFFLIYKNLTG